MRRIIIAVGAVLFLAFVVAIVYVVGSHPDLWKRPPEAATVECLKVPNGPELRLRDGVVTADDEVVASYGVEEAVPGKRGPRLAVRSIRIRQQGEMIVVDRGDENWYWPILGSGAVKMFFYPQNSVIAKPCNAAELSST